VSGLRSSTLSLELIQLAAEGPNTGTLSKNAVGERKAASAVALVNGSSKLTPG